MKWKLSKIYCKTLDDPWFDTLTPIQWYTYAMHINIDSEEEMEIRRDTVEYLARFWDNEAVEKVQRARERSRHIDQSEFEKQLEEMFGEKIHFESNKS